MDTAARRNLIIGAALCAGGVALTSTVPVISRYAMHNRGLDSSMFLAIWLITAGILSAVFRGRRARETPVSLGRHGRLLLGVAALHVVTAAAGFTSIHWVTAPAFAFIFSITVPLTFVLGWLVQGEKVGRWQVAGLAFAAVGTVLFVWRREAAQVQWIGVVLVIICAASTSVMDLVVKRKPADLPLWAVVSSRASGAGCLALILATGIRPVPWPEPDLLMLLLIGAVMGPFLGYLFIFKSYQYLPLTVAAVMRSLTPVVSTAYAMIVLSEALQWSQLPGAALIIAGAAVAPMRGRRNKET